MTPSGGPPMDAGQGLRALEQHTSRMLKLCTGGEICAVPLGALVDCLSGMQGTRFNNIQFIDTVVSTLAQYYELNRSSWKRLKQDFNLSRSAAYRCKDIVTSRGLLPYRSVSADKQVQGMLGGKSVGTPYKEVAWDLMAKALPECIDWIVPDHEAPTTLFVEFKGTADVFVGMDAFNTSLWLSHQVYMANPRDMPLGTSGVARLVGSMHTSLCLDPKEMYARLKFGMKTRPGDPVREAGTAPEGRLVRER